ncbi:MAG: rhamnulokinase [Promethearchaeota archaeon]
MNLIGIDLGASNGRIIVGILNEDKKLNLDIIYRFQNYGVSILNSFYWDVLRIFSKIKKGLSLAAKKYNDISSIGITTWGVDFALLDKNNELIGPIHHYRDQRTAGMLEKIFKIVPKKEIFEQTGIQFLSINTLVQLYSMVYNESPQLDAIKTFIMLPDYFNFLFSGKLTTEYSIATTSQLYNPKKKDWAIQLIKKLGFNTNWFLPVILPGTILGNIKKSIASEIGLNQYTKIISVLGHDTGSAIVAVPVDMNKYHPGEWAYLSSGTWSLIGIEIQEPIINDKVLKYNFTNEGGINETIRFLKNVTGLWIIQECKRIWEQKGLYLSWDDISNQALKSPPFQHFIDPDDPIFLNPPNMINAIKDYCKDHNQIPPESIGEISRTVFESLAFKYKEVSTKLEDIINTKIKILHIVGGGSQNSLLNQFTANILAIPVKAGPSEATAIGNILVQVLALGNIKNIKDLRNIVKKSFPPRDFVPKNIEKWRNAFNKYKELTK